MLAHVTHAHRYAKMRAHTATHLLHFLLHDLIPGGTKQAGSLVDDDFLRFDFAAKQALSPSDIALLNTSINSYIYAAIPVSVEEMSFVDAQKTGAKAFFEDKYGDTVRVVRIIQENVVGKEISIPVLTSIELCGGTHVHNTADIGAFHIISQESVASGVRRITAVTGTHVAQAYTDSVNELQHIATKLSCTPKQINEKIEKVIKELEYMKQEYTTMQGTIITTYLKELEPKNTAAELFARRICISGTPLEQWGFKDIITQAKILRSDRDWIIFTQDGNFAVYAGSGTSSAKTFAQEHGLSGGGSDMFVQGKDETICSLSL